MKKTNNQNTYDIAIIGAGAAGLFAAAMIRPERRCILLEKNSRPGQKLLLSGSGQCNLTHSGDMRDFLDHYGNNGKKIRTLLYKYNNHNMELFFVRQGLPLVPREDGKVFPQTMSAQDVLSRLLNAVKDNQVELKTGCSVSSLVKAADGSFCLTDQNGFSYTANKVLVTTGGCSYPKTGSDGGFFSVLQTLGITLTERKPALVPLSLDAYPYSSLAGISLPATLKLSKRSDPAGKKQQHTGDLLFTHRGLSGPLILNASRHVNAGDTVELSYLPAENSAGVYRLLQATTTGSGKQISTLLSDAPFLLPRRLSEQLCLRAGFAPEQKSSQLSGKQLRTLSNVVTQDRFTISGTSGFAVAMVTAGGVSLPAVELKTMESKECPGLFFAGEVLDVDGDTGGYNLQFAYSSAMCAVETI